MARGFGGFGKVDRVARRFYTALGVVSSFISSRKGGLAAVMPIDSVAIVRMCGGCRAEIETITVKKDNMRLFVEERVWCEGCQSEQPEVRDIAGRFETIRKEQGSYPVSPTSGPPRMEG